MFRPNTVPIQHTKGTLSIHSSTRARVQQQYTAAGKQLVRPTPRGWLAPTPHGVRETAYAYLLLGCTVLLDTAEVVVDYTLGIGVLLVL